LRFTANITVDQKTFETLKASAPALQPDAQTGEEELRLFGRTIKRGDRTVIELVVDEADQEEILDQVAAARRSTDIVLLALHSHEPSNQSEQPADFVRRFAQAAIDRGATIVVGHGPHQLRGIEVYRGGVIFHSLGNFLFPFEPLASRDADVFDGGVDLYALALGGIEEQGRRTPSPIDAAAWWESVVAVATFTNGALTGVQLHPLDLGVELAPERRGTPRAATPSRSAVILERLARLSAAFDTRIRIEGDTGKIDLGGGR
jgi:poly-gamma-glutamate synthesis protein (capsule biosynthesis protein)